MGKRMMATSTGELLVESAGTGPDLILLHSLLTDKDAFDPVVPTLSERWRVNKVSLPGFGGSARCQPSMDSFADSIGDLLRLGDFDPGTTTLVGNGFGGFVALGTAIRHGHLFDRMILIGCGTGFGREAAQVFDTMGNKVAAAGMSAIVDIALGRIFTAEYLAAHPEAGAERRRVLLRTDPESFIVACQALSAVDYKSEVGGVSNPTLVVVGSEDAATPPEMGRELARQMPRASFRLLPGLAHAPQLQDPEALVQAIREFLPDDGPPRELP